MVQRFASRRMHPGWLRRAGVGLLLSLGVVGVVQAQVPRQIYYQGHVARDGAALNGTFSMSFILYEAADIAIWTETQEVVVDEGRFDVTLGAVTPLTVPFSEPYTLGVTIAGFVGEIRYPLKSVAYAFRAIEADSVADNAVRAHHLAEGAIESRALRDGSVAEADLADEAVTADKLVDGAVVAGKLAPGSVQAANLAAEGADEGRVLAFVSGGLRWVEGQSGTIQGIVGADGIEGSGTEGVVTLSLAENGITTAKLGDGSVTTEKLATDAVTSIKIIDGAISSPKIQGSAVVTSKLADGAIIEAKLADQAITAQKLADRSVGAGKIDASGPANGRVLTYDNGTLVWAPPPEGTVFGVTAGAGLEGGGNSGDVTIGLANQGVTTNKLADAAVTETKLADEAVTTDKLANLSVTAEKIDASGPATGRVLTWDNGTLAWRDASSAFLPFNGQTVVPGTAVNVQTAAAADNVVAVRGEASAVGRITTGVLGISASTLGVGVRGVNTANGVAGQFDGRLVVNGPLFLNGGNDAIFSGDLDVHGTLSKAAGTFKIDHPLDPANKYLYHSFVESPDMMNVYNGNVVLNDQGEAWVELPAYFEALNGDFRYQLTCIGGFAPVYIADKIADNRFRIAGGQPDMEVSWQVTGVRKDPYAEQYRVQTEVDKPPADRGTYLFPEAYENPAPPPNQRR